MPTASEVSMAERVLAEEKREATYWTAVDKALSLDHAANIECDDIPSDYNILRRQYVSAVTLLTKLRGVASATY